MAARSHFHEWPRSKISRILYVAGSCRRSSRPNDKMFAKPQAKTIPVMQESCKLQRNEALQVLCCIVSVYSPCFWMPGHPPAHSDGCANIGVTSVIRQASHCARAQNGGSHGVTHSPAQSEGERKASVRLPSEESTFLSGGYSGFQ